MLYTFFDTETSGLESDCSILSFSYMLADENLKVQKAETLYFWKEGVTKWTEDAYAINKLSKAFLRQYADDYDKNMRKMYITLHLATLVGYNGGYVDKNGIIRGYDFPRCIHNLRDNGLLMPVAGELIDVMRIAESKFGKRYKLQTLFDELGLSRKVADAMNIAFFGSDGTAHTSSYDTVCTAMVFNKLYTPEEYVPAGEIIRKMEDVTWHLFFSDKNVLMAICKTPGEEDKIYTMEQLVATDKDAFDYLMKAPYEHMLSGGV